MGWWSLFRGVRRSAREEREKRFKCGTRSSKQHSTVRIIIITSCLCLSNYWLRLMIATYLSTFALSNCLTNNLLLLFLCVCLFYCVEKNERGVSNGHKSNPPPAFHIYLYIYIFISFLPSFLLELQNCSSANFACFICFTCCWSYFVLFRCWLSFFLYFYAKSFAKNGQLLMINIKNKAGEWICFCCFSSGLFCFLSLCPSLSLISLLRAHYRYTYISFPV